MCARLASAAAALAILSGAMATHAEPDRAQTGETTQTQQGSDQQENVRFSVDAARERAELMHRIYGVTLEAMHEHYFHGDRATVPARALEDVFAELDRQTGIQARWISVNTKPMSVGHEPKTEFEREAAKAISKGEPAHEKIDGDVYRRAAPIPLGEGCVSCHSGFFAAAPKSPRFAGLIISVPVNEKETSAK
jgi:hypothetical protein